MLKKKQPPGEVVTEKGEDERTGGKGREMGREERGAGGRESIQAGGRGRSSLPGYVDVSRYLVYRGYYLQFDSENLDYI